MHCIECCTVLYCIVLPCVVANHLNVCINLVFKCYILYNNGYNGYNSVLCKHITPHNTTPHNIRSFVL